MTTGRLAISAIALVAATVIAVSLLEKTPWWSDHDETAPGTEAPGASPGEKPLLAPPVESPGAEPFHEGREGGLGSPRSKGEDDTVSRVRNSDSRGATGVGARGEPARADTRLAGDGDSYGSSPPRSPDGHGGRSRGQDVPPPSAPASAAPGHRPTTVSPDGSHPGPLDSGTIVPAAPSPEPHGSQAPPESDPEDSPPDEKPPADDEGGGSNRKAPVLESLRFDPPEVQDGNVTTLMIQIASDDLSGARVSGTVQSPSGAGSLRFEAQGGSGINVVPVSITIPSKAEAGVWYVSSLLVLDRASYSLNEAFTARTVPAGGTVRVSSAEPDTTAPIVRSASVERGPWGDNEKALVKVDVEDDRSGVASVSGAFQSPSRSALLWFEGKLSPESSLWEGEVRIPANADCGEWTLHQLRAGDKAGNVTQLSSDSPPLAQVSFLVSTRSGCDSTAPTLERLDLSPPVVLQETGAEVRVTATVHDEGSGATSVSGWADGPDSTEGQRARIHFSCARDPGNTGDIWTAKIPVPQHAAKGTWRVGMVQLRDGALNTRDYGASDPVIVQAVFEVE